MLPVTGSLGKRGVARRFLYRSLEWTAQILPHWLDRLAGTGEALRLS